MNKFIYAILLILPSYSFGMSYSDYIFLNNSNQCNNYFNHLEEKHNIPKHLLRSISVIETGRWHKDANAYFTWPWTINQEGKSYYFSTKNEAIEKARSMLEKGITNIDIGCMQINLHHHPEAFDNLEQAFDPKENIEYAANFLKKNYYLSNDWNRAIALYHSQRSIGEEYANKVIRIHSKYNDKKLDYNFCISNIGTIISCNKLTGQEKEKLPFLNSDDNNIILAKVEPKKSLKRRKSNMITYSVNN